MSSRSKERLDEALSLLERRITICEQEAERLEKIRQKLKASDPHHKRKTGTTYSRYLGNTYVDKGRVWQTLENRRQARSWLNKGIRCLEGVGDRPGLIFAYGKLAHLEMQAKHYPDARDKFKEMERVATDCGRDEDAAKALRGIADALWEFRKEDAANAAVAIAKKREAAGRFRSVGDNESATKEDDRADSWEASLAASGGRR